MSSKTKYSKQFFYGDRSVNETYQEIVHMLNNKYYNIFRSNFKTTGLSYREEQFIMNKLWNNGTIAAFKIKHTDKLGFCNWARVTWDMYGEPETVQLINEYGSPLIPTSIQTVDKDVVIGYIQSNRKPVKLIVDWYIRRIAQVECIINTNLHLQKMPFIIPVSDENEKAKLEDVVQRILNNELVICVDGVEPGIFKSISTNVPYVVDKLQNYKKDLENDLLTYLGVNNNGSNKIEQLQLSEVNSNNEEINLSDSNFNDNLGQFSDRLMETFNATVRIEVSSPDAEADGQVHENKEKTGPKESEESEEE